MQQKTRTTTTQRPAGPLADAGPYDYDLPATRVVGPPPAAQPRHRWKTKSLSLVNTGAIIFISFFAPFLKESTGWRSLDCYMLLYAAYTILAYWTVPQTKPRQGFVRWSLKMLGVWLNCYVALVTVPESLRGTLPEPLAFGLPAFLTTIGLYAVAPVSPNTGRRWPLWQWLLWATWATIVWAWYGPTLIK